MNALKNPPTPFAKGSEDEFKKLDPSRSYSQRLKNVDVRRPDCFLQKSADKIPLAPLL
jgi:hypothetical protein